MIGSDGGGSPVHAGHGFVHHVVYQRGVHAALVENHVEGRSRNGAELRRAYAFHAADERGVVVLAAHQHFRGFADADDVRAGHDKTGTSFVHGIHAHKGLIITFAGETPPHILEKSPLPLRFQMGSHKADQTAELMGEAGFVVIPDHDLEHGLVHDRGE